MVGGTGGFVGGAVSGFIEAWQSKTLEEALERSVEAGKFDGFISGGTGGALAPFAKTAQAASKAGGLVDDAARLTNGKLDDAANLADDLPGAPNIPKNGHSKTQVPAPNAAGLLKSANEAIEKVKAAGINDCEQAAAMLKKVLGKGKTVDLPVKSGNHTALFLEQEDIYLDITGLSHVIKNGYWTKDALSKAGLLEAAEKGLFTKQQYNAFIKPFSDLL